MTDWSVIEGKEALLQKGVKVAGSRNAKGRTPCQGLVSLGDGIRNKPQYCLVDFSGIRECRVNLGATELGWGMVPWPDSGAPSNCSRGGCCWCFKCL